MLLRRKPENWDVVLNFLCLRKSTISAFRDVLEKEILHKLFGWGILLSDRPKLDKILHICQFRLSSQFCFSSDLFPLGKRWLIWFGLVVYAAISSRALPVVFGKSRDLLYCVWQRGWIWKHKCWIYRAAPQQCILKALVLPPTSYFLLLY